MNIINKNPLTLLVLFIVIVLIVSIPITVYLVQKQQHLLGRAQMLINPNQKETLIALSTNYTSYYLREKIVLRAQNQSPSKITLQNSVPWSVERWSGQRWVEVFRPASLQVSTPIEPGETKEWLWDQKDSQGQFVSAASYRFNLAYGGRSYTTDFKITPQMGSGGYFTFDITGQTLRIYITNPQSVRDAIENFYGLNQKGIPNGILADDRPGKSPFDRQWSWHMKPEDIRMVSEAIELCDGVPSDVENNLDYWLKIVRRFCPWSARIRYLQ